MSIDIRPFNESDSDTTSPESVPDSRTSAFMEALRARVNSEDEARQQKWDKVAAKPTSRRKPAAAPPDWLVHNKPAKETPKPSKFVHPHPLASTGKRRRGS